MVKRTRRIKWVEGWGFSALLFAGTATMLGCVDERTLLIVQNQVPEAGCIIPGSEGDVYRSGGVLDVSGGRGYTLFPLVRNDLPSSTSLDDQPERNFISLRRFEITLDLGQAAGENVPAEFVDFDVPTSALMDPGQVRASSVKVMNDLLLPFLSVPRGIRIPTTATVRAVADHGGGTLKSPEFIYPIELCDGCLVTVLSACPGPDDTTTIAPNICGIPQDGAVTCCNDSQRGFVCLQGGEAD